MTSCFFRKPNFGILLFRFVVGGLIFYHGVQHLLEGKETWIFLGQTMTYLGIDFALPMWGLLAALTESLGGLCFILGIFFRPACFFLAFTMAMALVYHATHEQSLIKEGGQALLFFTSFLSFLFIGSGRMSICRRESCEASCKPVQD